MSRLYLGRTGPWLWQQTSIQETSNVSQVITTIQLHKRTGSALFAKEARGSDMLIHKGVVCLFFFMPLPFEEPRVRNPGTNGFVKADGSDPGNVDHYTSSGCACNGLSISVRLC